MSADKTVFLAKLWASQFPSRRTCWNIQLLNIPPSLLVSSMTWPYNVWQWPEPFKASIIRIYTITFNNNSKQAQLLSKKHSPSSCQSFGHFYGLNRANILLQSSNDLPSMITVNYTNTCRTRFFKEGCVKVRIQHMLA